jgi:hypothetical protein
MKTNVVLNFMSNHVVEQYDLLSRISNIHFHIIQLLVCMEGVVESFILFMYPSFFGDL